MRYWFPILVLIVLMSAVAFAQTEFMVSCQGGVCQMRESDLMKLQAIINALVGRVEELQAKGGCT